MSQTIRELWDGASRKAKLSVVGVILLIAGFYAFPLVKGWLGNSRPESQVAAAPEGSFKATDGQWATLKTVVVGTQIFQTERDTDGEIALDDDASTPIFSPYSGRVTKVFAKAGAKIAKGEPLFAIEASEFVQGQNDLIAALAGAASAKAALTLAETTEKRAHDLYDAKGGAMKDWQQAQSDLVSARSAASIAEVALGAARNRLRILGKTESEIAALEAAPNSATLSGETIVPSPISGTVTQRQIAPGEYINSAAASGAQIYMIGDLSSLWLIANLREADAPLAHLGDSVEVQVPAYPGRLFKGKLVYVAPTIDPTTRRLALRAEIKNADGALKPEMFANIRLIAGDENSSPAVPDSAVIYEGAMAHVWIANPADKSVGLRAIKVGRLHDGMVEVIEGLKAGETVVTKGALFIDRAAKGD